MVGIYYHLAFGKQIFFPVTSELVEAKPLLYDKVYEDNGEITN